MNQVAKAPLSRVLPRRSSQHRRPSLTGRKENMKILFRFSLIALYLHLFALSACSPVFEATRPDPVDLSQFVVGENRVQVVEQLGAPTATVNDGDNSCDVYKLYTHGPGSVSKGLIAFFEAAADVVTLCLAEILFTPLETATRNSKHTVMVCYGPDGKLTAVKESDSSPN